MAEPLSATLTPEEATYNREWAKARLQQLKASKRQTSRKDYGLGQKTIGQALTSMPTAEERRETWDRANEMLPSPSPTGVQGRGADVMEQRVKRYSELRQARKMRDTGKSAAALAPTVDAEAQAMARQAYARVWDVAQEALEDLSFAFFGLLSVVTIVPLVAIYLTRWIGGFGMNGVRNITFRDMSVPLVPKYDWITGPMHTFKLLLVVIISGIIFVIALGLVMAIGGYLKSWCGWMGLVLNSFLPGLCS